MSTIKKVPLVLHVDTDEELQGNFQIQGTNSRGAQKLVGYLFKQGTYRAVTYSVTKKITDLLDKTLVHHDEVLVKFLEKNETCLVVGSAAHSSFEKKLKQKLLDSPPNLAEQEQQSSSSPKLCPSEELIVDPADFPIKEFDIWRSNDVISNLAMDLRQLATQVGPHMVRSAVGGSDVEWEDVNKYWDGLKKAGVTAKSSFIDVNRILKYLLDQPVYAGGLGLTPLVIMKLNDKIGELSDEQLGSRSIALTRSLMLNSAPRRRRLILKNRFKSKPQSSAPTSGRLITQLDVLLLDVTGSMEFCKSPLDGSKTRFDVAKILFQAMGDRYAATDPGHAVCLMSFAERTDTLFRVNLGFTTDLGALERAIGYLACEEGRTPLYTALNGAADKLIEYQALNKTKLIENCPMRIFAMTDGEDNESQLDAHSVALKMQQNGIICDSFLMGDLNLKLQSISTATGGYSVKVDAFNQGQSLFSREALISVAARPEAEKTPKPAVYSAGALAAHESRAKVVSGMSRTNLESAAAKAKVVDADVMMAEAIKADRDEKLKEQQESMKKKKKDEDDGTAPPRRVVGLQAVLREYRDLIEQEEYGKEYRVFPEEDNVFKWKVLLASPEDSMYKGRVFLCSLEFQQDYSSGNGQFNFRFITPIYSMNISEDGKIGQGVGCGDVAKTRGTSPEHCFILMRSVMRNPNLETALVVARGEEYRTNKQQYEQFAFKHATENAFVNMDAAVRYIDELVAEQEEEDEGDASPANANRSSRPSRGTKRNR